MGSFFEAAILHSATTNTTQFVSFAGVNTDCIQKGSLDGGKALMYSPANNQYGEDVNG